MPDYNGLPQTCRVEHVVSSCGPMPKDTTLYNISRRMSGGAISSRHSARDRLCSGETKPRKLSPSLTVRPQYTSGAPKKPKKLSEINSNYYQWYSSTTGKRANVGRILSRQISSNLQI
ncbi:unnamed protein product [Arctia plantaginis]|uniref:Uncharacterized protein n=1 Tax=Arctia plantaginis TaxID=874455 RepID=A0A8S0ZS53_ARCPL|nr:unnamed protein product [Arctia plantaginis]